MEAGDGRRAQTVYLKPKKKVPAPALASLTRPPHPPLFLKFGSIPVLLALEGPGRQQPNALQRSLPGPLCHHNQQRLPLSLSAGQF